jgi:Protein of unknown function (DUF3105)
LPKALRFALALVVALAAVVGLLLFVQSRDRSTFSGDDAATTKGGPGRLLPDQGADHRRPPAGFQFATDPPASGPHLPTPMRREAPMSRNQLLQALEAGDIVLFYDKASDEAALRGVAEDIAGPFDPALATAGQAVIVEHRPRTAGVIALAWRRMLKAPSATDPRVHAFADAWLGKGKAG